MNKSIYCFRKEETNEPPQVQKFLSFIKNTEPYNITLDHYPFRKKIRGESTHVIELKNKKYLLHYFQKGRRGQINDSMKKRFDEFGKLNLFPKLIWMSFDEGIVVFDYYEVLPIDQDIWNRPEIFKKIIGKLLVISEVSQELHYYRHQYDYEFDKIFEKKDVLLNKRMKEIIQEIKNFNERINTSLTPKVMGLPRIAIDDIFIDPISNEVYFYGLENITLTYPLQELSYILNSMPLNNFQLNYLEKYLNEPKIAWSRKLNYYNFALYSLSAFLIKKNQKKDSDESDAALKELAQVCLELEHDDFDKVKKEFYFKNLFAVLKKIQEKNQMHQLGCLLLNSFIKISTKN